ncbi:hypothetical protein VaNZ11_003084 [Volvox africanus]|uniref:F-box domain-containing protein n=1 Tax=Volvox africanus TaxID=51714 RepID=A0ABQ5RTH5_9CHLO|nr:hypothetical protein VaNZ11_003084 [Volvox africanus]
MKGWNMDAEGLLGKVPLDAAVEGKVTTWRDLPDHLLEAIGSHVYGNDYLTARLVCQVWRRALSPVTRTVKVHLHHSQLDPATRLLAIQDAFPRACRMAIYVDANTERAGFDLTAVCRETLRAMAYTTAPEPAACHHLSNQQRQPGPRQQQRGGDCGVITTAARVAVDCHMPDGGSDGGPGPPAMSGSDMLEHPTRGSCTGRVGTGSDGKSGDLFGCGKLMWQFMSVTVGASVLPLNREQVDFTTHRLMSSGQWVGRQLAAAFAASQSALCNFRHLTTLELTSDTSLFAALLPHLARPGVTPSLTELRFTRAEASRGTLGRWMVVAGAADAGARRGGLGEEMAEALDALGSLTGLRSLALNTGLPGLPAAVSRLSHLGFLELHHSGRGVAMVEDVAPLEALTGLTSLKLRYVALRHTWQLTRLTALTGLDLTLRAFCASDGAADGDNDLGDLDVMDAVMEDGWAGAPAQVAAAPPGMDDQGNIGAAAVAVIAPPGGHPAAVAAAPPPPQQLQFEFILPPGQPPQPLGGGASVAPAPVQFLHEPPHILLAPGAQGPLGALQLFQAQAQQQQAAQQPTVQAGAPAVAPAMTLPSIGHHPQVPGAWLEPPFELLIHEHPPHTHSHNTSPNQAQQQAPTHGPHQQAPPNRYLLEPPLEQSSNGISQQPQQQQQQQFSHLQFPQLQQLPIFSYHEQQVPSETPSSTPVSTDCLLQRLSPGSAASVSLSATPPPTSSANLGNAPFSVSGAAEHVGATAAAAALPPLVSMAPSPTFRSSSQEPGSMLLNCLQTAAAATVNKQNGGGGGSDMMAGSRATQLPGSWATRAATMSAVDDVSGRRPACDGVVNEAGAGASSGKHHAGFGSWMFGDSGRESDSDGAITFSLASSAAGSDWLVDDDGTGKEGGGGNGSASIVGSMGDRLVRRGGADEGRAIHTNVMTSDNNAAAGGVGCATGNEVIGRISFVSSLGAGTSTQLASVPSELAMSKVGPALRTGDSRGETAAIRTCAQVSIPLSAISPPSSSTRDAGVVSAATVLAGMMAPVSNDVPQGVDDRLHISPGSDIQTSAFAGPLGSSWGSGSSGDSGNGGGVVPMELGAYDAEAQYAPCRAVGESFTGTMMGNEHAVGDARAAETLQMVQPAAVTAALQPPAALMEPAIEPAPPIAAPIAATSAADVATALEEVTAGAVAAVAGGVPDQHGGDGDGAQAGPVNEAGMEDMVQVEGWQPDGADVDEEDEEEAEDEDDTESDGELDEAELARHDAAVSLELWRVVAALPGLKALNVNAWHEAPLDDERLGELAKLSLPLTGQLPVPGLTSLGLLLQASSASSHLSAVSDLTILKDLTLVVAPPKGTGGRQPPLAAASVQLSTLDIEYDSDDDFDVRKSNAGPPVARIIDDTMGMHADGEAVMTPGADSWKACATASAEPRRMAVGGLNVDSDTEMEEPSGDPPQRHTDGAVCALTCSGASGRGGSVGAAAAGDTTPANPGDVAVHAAASGSPVCHLAALTSLERLRLYDDPGALPVDQDAAKLLSRAWSRMNDIYILGSITLQRSTDLTFCRLAHLDLFNQTSTVPYRLQLHHLPPSMRALGVQNAVLEGASRASQVQSVLEGLSLYATVHWPTRANGGMDMYDWIAGCSRLASLTIEYDMRTFANIMNGDVAAAGTGAATTAPDPARPFRPLLRTPLHRLASLPALATLGVFFADSHQELLAGVLDQRLVDDVAELAFLEELEIWNVYGTDWNLDHTDFSPFARLSRLRSLKMEALPPYMPFRIRRIMQEGVPYCKLRLVADNEMPAMIPAIAVAAASGLALQAVQLPEAAVAAAADEARAGAAP